MKAEFTHLEALFCEERVGTFSGKTRRNLSQILEDYKLNKNVLVQAGVNYRNTYLLRLSGTRDAIQVGTAALAYQFDHAALAEAIRHFLSQFPSGIHAGGKIARGK